MKNGSIPQISRRKFIGLGAAVMTAAAWGSVQILQQQASFVALNFGDFANAVKLAQIERLLARYPGVAVTLLPTLQEIDAVLSDDAKSWQRWLNSGHEIGFAAGQGQLSAEFLQWRSRLGTTYQPHFATDLRNQPSKSLTVHSARHGLLVAAWQSMSSAPTAEQVMAQRSMLISAETVDLVTLEQLLIQLTEQGQQMVTLTELMRQNRQSIERVEVDTVGYQGAYDWLT